MGVTTKFTFCAAPAPVFTATPFPVTHGQPSQSCQVQVEIAWCAMARQTRSTRLKIAAQVLVECSDTQFLETHGQRLLRCRQQAAKDVRCYGMVRITSITYKAEQVAVFSDTQLLETLGLVQE